MKLYFALLLFISNYSKYILFIYKNLYYELLSFNVNMESCKNHNTGNSLLSAIIQKSVEKSHADFVKGTRVILTSGVDYKNASPLPRFYAHC